MINPRCPVCREELFEPEPQIDNWCRDDDDNICRSFIVREMKCTNPECQLFEKRLDVFFDYTHIDVEGDKIDFDELKKKYEKKRKE